MPGSDWYETDMPDQVGQVAVITGANSGIGLEAARALAQHGARVIMGCRNPVKAADAKARIDATKPRGTTELLALDLADLDSVRSAADELHDRVDHVDLLVNNAGLMAPPLQRTAQGFEVQLGVNHLGHFVLTNLVLDLLDAAPAARVVSISSQGHRPGRIALDDLNSERRYSAWPAYFQSKLANLLFTNELQTRLTAAGSSVIAVAAHPGASHTNLGHEGAGGVVGTTFSTLRPYLEVRFSQSAQMGAQPTLRAATDPGVVGGDYFGPDGLFEMQGHPVRVGMTAKARDAALAAQLWERSEQLTGERSRI